jgi:TolB-like protein/class 3 adenylate cyclase/Tfp pilus assembly protein PilF
MATARVERRLSAILAADVVGYSRLMERDEAGTFERLKRLRKELIEPVLERYGGRFVDLKGDGAIVEFGSVAAAVEAAVEIQRAMLDQDPELPETMRIRYRIGINLGDVIVDGDTIYGDGVNVAARIESLCEPGGVWLSRSVYNQVKGKFNLALVPSGLHQVKNISEAVETFRVAFDGIMPAAHRPTVTGLQARRWKLPAVGALLALFLSSGAWLFWPGEPPPNQQPGIAVLPFATQGGEAKEERFADGLTEDLIIELARYRYLFVIARSSVIPYKGRATDVRQIGRELGVRYVFQGSLDGEADRVRVTAQLVDATNSSQIWSERYDRPLADLFSLRDDIVQHITGALISTLNRADAELARRKPPASLQAYDFYAIGRDLFRSDGVTKENMAKARSYFEKALAIDPHFSRAWYLVGWTHFNDAHLGWADDQARSWALFHEAARRAVVADPSDATAQTLAGVSHFRLREFEAGELAWQLALRFGPNDYSTLRDTGCMFAMVFGTERAAEGLEITKRALRLNPMHPAWQLNCLGTASYFAGRYEDAVAALLNANGAVVEDQIFLAMAYAQLGRAREAATEAAKVFKQRPGFSAEAWVDNDVYRPGGSAVTLFFDGARKAGLALCATVSEAAQIDPKNRLPECDIERARAVQPPT